MKENKSLLRDISIAIQEILDYNADLEYKVIEQDSVYKKRVQNVIEEIEEEKKIPEKINVWYEFNSTYDKELTKIMLDELKDKYNEIIDYLQSKGEKQ